MSVEAKAKCPVAETPTTAAPAAKADKAAKPKVAAKTALKTTAAKATKPKPAPETAPAKKVAGPKPAKTESSDRRSAYPSDATIRVIDLSKCDLKGKRGAAVKALRDNMTVEQYRSALVKTKVASLETYVGWALTTAIAAKAITVKA